MKSLVDWRGKKHRLDRAPRRVVSLVPSTTDTLFALGLGERVLGVTRYCVHPAEAVAGRRRVGGTKNPDIDAILALEPDMVLMNAEENRPIDVERLDEAGVPVHVSLPGSVAETSAYVQELGDMFDVEPGAQTMIDDIAAAVAEAGRPAWRPRVLYLVWWQPMMTVNRTTYIHDLLACAGAENAFANHEARYPKVDWPEIEAAAIDVVLMSSEPYAFGPVEAAEIRRHEGIPGVVAGRVHHVDGELGSWHGARTARGIRHLLDVIHPGRRPVG